jgi:hypothetical protein
MLEPTYLRCLRVALLAVLLACGACERNDAGASTPTTSPGGAQQAAMRVDGGRGFTGVFHTTVDGRRRVVNLTERDGHLTGMIDTASLDARVSGSTASGELKDPGTAMKLGTVELALDRDGDALVLNLTAVDAQGGRSLKLPPVTYTRGAPPPPVDVQLDAQLAGRWRHSWTADGASAAGDVWLVLHPDGRAEYGRARSSGSDDLSVETSGDDGFAGRWRTSDRTLHVMPEGDSHWTAFAGYAIDGQKLALRFNDGSKQVYYRQ